MLNRLKDVDEELRRCHEVRREVVIVTMRCGGGGGGGGDTTGDDGGEGEGEMLC